LKGLAVEPELTAEALKLSFIRSVKARRFKNALIVTVIAYLERDRFILKRIRHLRSSLRTRLVRRSGGEHRSASRWLRRFALRLYATSLKLGEDLLDRIEVRAVGRQKEQLGADRADGTAHGFPFVAAEIVDDHDISGLEGGHEH